MINALSLYKFKDKYVIIQRKEFLKYLKAQKFGPNSGDPKKKP